MSRHEKAYEKYAWILVVLSGVIALPLAVTHILFGGHIFQTGTGYPQAALNDLSMAERVVGAFGLPYAVLQIGVGANAFRTGERWAWFVLLSVPLGAAINSYLDATVGVPVIGAVVIFFLYGGLTLIGLLLSIRRFFPKKQPLTS